MLSAFVYRVSTFRRIATVDGRGRTAVFTGASAGVVAAANPAAVP